MGAGLGWGWRPRGVSDVVTGTRALGHRARVSWRLSFQPPRRLPFAGGGQGRSPGAARHSSRRQLAPGLGGAGEGADSSDKVVTGILRQDASGESPSGERREVMGGWGRGEQ